jgi:hypothetical protein
MAPPLLRIAMKRIEHTVEEELREQRVLALQGVPEAAAHAVPAEALAARQPQLRQESPSGPVR